MLVALYGVAVLLCVFVSSRPEDQLLVGLLTFMAAILELVAPRLPRFGFLSSAFPCYFTLALSPQGSPGVAALVAAGLLLIRSFVRGGKGLWVLEMLTDGLPTLGALLMAGLVAGISGPSLGRGGVEGFPGGLLATACSLAIFMLLGHLLPGWLADKLEPPVSTKSIGLIRLQLRSVAMFGPVMLLLSAHSPWQVLWITPIFLGMHQFMWERLQEFRNIQGRYRKTHQALKHTGQKLEKTSRSLHHTVEDKTLVENCARTFARSQALAATLAEIVRFAQVLYNGSSAAVFLNRDNRLVPVYCVGPHRERAQSHALLALGEPLVERCWESGAPTLLSAEDIGVERLFQDDRKAVALPMHPMGVLYVGDPRLEVEPDSLPRLCLLADQAALGLQSITRRQQLEGALEQAAKANSHLQLWNDRLFRLLTGSRSLSQTLSLEEVMQRLEMVLKEVVPFDLGAVIEVRTWTFGDGQVETASLQSIAEAVIEQNHPIVLDDIRQSKLPPVYSDQRALLALPLNLSSPGVLLIAASEVAAYTRDHVQICALLAQHLCTILSNCHLYAEVVLARKDLEESQAQLLQSSKMAAVGQLAAGVAHEINTPLAAVMLALQSAQKGLKRNPLDRTQKKLEQSTRGIKKAKDIVAKLLFYSREAAVDNRPVQLSQVARDTLEFLGSQLELDGVNLVTAIEEVPPVSGNQNELQQVVTNLLLNARDAVLGVQTKRIHLSTGTSDAQVWIAVEDTGSGMGPELQEKIFDPFFTSKPVGEGTGLGLYVTHRIVTDHGGTIRVQSEAGKGSRFSVIFPLEDGADQKGERCSK